MLHCLVGVDVDERLNCSIGEECRWAWAQSTKASAGPAILLWEEISLPRITTESSAWCAASRDLSAFYTTARRSSGCWAGLEIPKTHVLG